MVMEPAIVEDVSQQELRRRIFSMVWPATIESVLQMMVGIVATAMVGKLGAQAIGAVGLGNRVAHIIWVIFQAIGTGATVFVARAIGAKDLDLAKRMAMQALCLGVVLVLAFALLGYIFAAEILHWFGTDLDLFEVAYPYLRLVVWGMPFMAVMQIVGAILRGAGNTRTPMLIALIMNVINICVSYVLIFGRGGLPALGINGAAYGAIIAQGISAVLALIVIYRPKAVVPLRQARLFHFSFTDIKRLLRIGLPVAAESLYWQIATIYIMKWIVGFGTIPLAAHQLGLTAESLSYMPSAGFSIAATALVGQSLGQKNSNLAERYFREIRKWGIMFTVVAASILLFLPTFILSLLTNDVAVIELGKYYLILMAFAQFPQQISSVMVGALRGAGITRQPMINAAIGLWLIRFPGAYFFGVVRGYGVIGVWSAMTIDIFIRFMLNYWLFSKAQWKTANQI